ncbi:MAG: hypothetical protein AAF969_12865 [Bacteroidota bacterium]
MEKKRVFVLFEDDTEILGNGQGHVMYRLYLPVLRYVELLKKYQIKSTFYVDIAHLLFLRNHAAIKDFGLQADLIEKSILYLLENDMEVQMHLHSQYVNATLENDRIKVTNKWNIGQLTEVEQKDLFHNAFECLESILQKSSKSRPLSSFKGGSWGLQPFKTLYTEFRKMGITIVFGPVKGLKVNSLGIDYCSLESNQHPYYCDVSDINKIGTEKELIVVPMTPTYLNWFDLTRYLIHLKFQGFLKKFDKQLDLGNEVAKIKFFNPLAGKDKLKMSLRPFQTHLKINAQPFWYLKKTFRRSYNAILKNEHEFKLIVVETHTKDFKNNFVDIERFFEFLTKEYPNIEYITSSQLFGQLEDGSLNPLLKK